MLIDTSGRLARKAKTGDESANNKSAASKRSIEDRSDDQVDLIYYKEVICKLIDNDSFAVDF